MSNVIPFPSKKAASSKPTVSLTISSTGEEAVVTDISRANAALARIETLTKELKRSTSHDNSIPSTVPVTNTAQSDSLEKANQEYFDRLQKKLAELRRENNSRTAREYRLTRKPPSPSK